MPNIKKAMMAAAGADTLEDISGTLWGTGSNNSGVIGDGTTIYRSTLVQVGALTNWAVVSGTPGSQNSTAIKTDGTMWAWGDDNFGRLGLNTTNIDRSSPTQIGALTTWSKVARMSNGCHAIKTDGMGQK